MTAKKFICWREHEGQRLTDEYEIHAPDAETAAEWFAEDQYQDDPDSYLSGEVEVTVRAQDGTVYGVTIEVSTRKQFTVRPS